MAQNLVDRMDDLGYLAPTSPKPVKVYGKCQQHGEELKLYCQTDNRLICVVCRESRSHRFVPMVLFSCPPLLLTFSRHL